MSVTAAVNYSAIEVNGNIGQTKVKRYRPGKAPEWTDNHVGDHEGKNDNIPMSGSVVLEKGYDRRLSRLAENRLYDDQQDKLNAVKPRLLYGDESEKNPRDREESHYSESKTPTAQTEPRRRHGNRHSQSPSPTVNVFKRLRRNRPPSPRLRPRKEGVYSKGWEEKNKTHLHVLTATTKVPTERELKCNQEGIITGVRRHEEPADIWEVKTARGTESWAMPTWCHMFNSTLTGNARVWFDKLPKEFINSYEDLRAAFRENYLRQTKHIKDPVEIHHIKQRDGESTEDFMERYKAELIKRLYEKILRSMDEMYKVTTSFLQWEVAAFSHGQKKAPMSWKQPEVGNKPNFRKGFKNKQRSDRNPDRFSLLTKTPKEIFALEKGRFKAPPPMVTPTKKRDPNKYFEFHADTRHSTDECMQLRKQIDEMIKSGKLSQFIKELKHNDKPKAPKKGETAGKDKPLTILMVLSWEKVAKQRITQSFSPGIVISFPPLGDEDETEGPMIIEAEIGGHFIHRMYVDGGASSEILYEHCFIRLWPETRRRMVPATTHLIGFSGETIWPLGSIVLEKGYDRRLSRLAENRLDDKEEIRADHRRIRQAEIVSNEEEEKIEENAERKVASEEQEEKRKMLKKMRRMRTRRGSLSMSQIQRMSRWVIWLYMMKPVFVKKSERDTSADREKIEAAELAIEEFMKMRVEERKVETKKIHVEVIRKDMEIQKNKEREGEVDTDNDENIFEAWIPRETARIKRDREVRDTVVQEKEEIEKVRNMTEEERKNPKPDDDTAGTTVLMGFSNMITPHQLVKIRWTGQG
ncbi:reverse transcriptase domain-containing protein [Tanacetum coccineum]